MSLPAARRKHCDQAHPYQQKLKDGISLLGRETPGYILQEVKRRQAEDRGTASHWAKLAAEYGPRHANFITSHNMRLPTSRNDRNSWGHIAQSFAHTRGRPASAPPLRAASARAKAEGPWLAGSHRVQSARRSVKYGDDSHTDGPMSLFARTKEIEAVVEIMRDTEKSHWVPKAKKGQRRKVAEAAAKATATVRSKKVHSGSRQRPRSAFGVNSDTGRRTAMQPGGGRWRSKARPKTAQFIISNMRPQPAVSEQRQNANLAGSADEKLGMTARTRMYSFTGEMGSGHQNSMLRATHAAAGDAHRRCRPSTAGATRRPDVDGRGIDGKNKTAAWVSGRSDADTSGRPLSARETAGTDNVDNTDTQEHLGVVDLSKLTTILSHAQVNGYCHTGGDHRGFNQSDRSDPGFNGIRQNTPLLLHDHPNGATRTEGINLSSPKKAWQPAPQETEGVASNGGRSKYIATSPGLRAGGALAKGSVWHTRDNCAGPEQSSTGSSEPPSVRGSDAGGDGGLGSEAGNKSESFGAAEVTGVGSARLRSEATMPQRDCLRGRYSRAQCKSKSSYAAKKKGSTMAESRFTHTQSSTVPSPNGTRCHPSGYTGSSNESSHTSITPSCREGRRSKGTNNAAEAMSWQERLVAVQRRRGVLEEAMGAAKKRLVNRRALIETRNRSGAKGSTEGQVAVPLSIRGAACVVGLNDARKYQKRPHRQQKREREPPRRHVAAASRIQLAFRCFLQRRLWLGDKCDREFVSLVASEDDGGEYDDINDPPGARSSSWEGDPASEEQRVPRVVEGASYRTKRTHQRHLAIRAMRLLRGYIHCTQARFLLLQLLWERVEGDILGERRSHRAAIETRAAIAIQPIAHIRRLAVGLIKLQKSAKMYQMECQAKLAKQGKQGKNINSSNKFKDKKDGGHAEGGFETAKQARSEKDECEAILREHGRRGRRLVDVSVRNRLLMDLLYSYRRQHVIRDQKEYLMESSRPPMVDSGDVKRMLACPTEEMHMFSDPQNYRTRSRHTRLVLPFREVEGVIQDTIGSHMRSTYRSKVKEALGTDLASTNPEPQPELGIPPTTTSAKFPRSAPLATDRTINSIADKLQRQEVAGRVDSANESYSATAFALQPVSEVQGPAVETQIPPAATIGGNMGCGRRTAAVVKHRKAASSMGILDGNVSS